MSAVNNQYKYKTPAQIKGKRSLRNRNLLVPQSALHNIEVVKRKARAVRLKEEYKRKYLTRSNTRRLLPSTPLNSDNTIYSIVKRTLSFCIKLGLVSASSSYLYLSGVLSSFHLLLNLI